MLFELFVTRGFAVHVDFCLTAFLQACLCQWILWKFTAYIDSIPSVSNNWQQTFPPPFFPHWNSLAKFSDYWHWGRKGLAWFFSETAGWDHFSYPCILGFLIGSWFSGSLYLLLSEAHSSTRISMQLTGMHAIGCFMPASFYKKYTMFLGKELIIRVYYWSQLISTCIRIPEQAEVWHILPHAGLLCWVKHEISCLPMPLDNAWSHKLPILVKLLPESKATLMWGEVMAWPDFSQTHRCHSLPPPAIPAAGPAKIQGVLPLYLQREGPQFFTSDKTPDIS